MKKDIRNLFILIVFLLVVSFFVIIIKGRTCVVELNIGDYNALNVNAKVENKSGEVKILSERTKDGIRYVRLKSVKPGKADVYLDFGELIAMETLYIHKNKVITVNNFYGKSTWGEVIPLSITIVLIYITHLFIKAYKASVKKNLYQYKNIAFLGIIVFLCSFTLSIFLSTFNYLGLYGMFSSFISSTQTLSVIMFPVALVTFILVTISNIRLVFREGKSLKNLLGLFLGIFLCVLTLLPDFVYKFLMKSQIVDIYNLNGPGPYIYNFIESIVYLTVAYLECVLIGTIVIGIKAFKKKVEYNKDYMIILGCQIKKDGSLTPLLRGRVDKALEFRNKQMELTKKDLIFVPSGGQGKNEVISEGEAIKNYLLEQGIDKKKILVEDKSTNTYENIKFSCKLINKKSANIGFATTNYHVLRAGLIATSQGLYLEGIGGKTKAYFAINAFIREFIGTLYAEKKKHIIVFILILVIVLILIIFLFFANNI